MSHNSSHVSRLRIHENHLRCLMSSLKINSGGTPMVFIIQKDLFIIYAWLIEIKS